MRDTRQLRRLIALSRKHRAPLTLAVVSMRFDDSLVRILGGAPPWVTVCIHGADHRNRAAPGGDKSEFPESRDPEECMEALVSGWDRLRGAFGARATPVLAPPWNRVSDGVRSRLSAAGFRLSDASTVHIDPIKWWGSRSILNGVKHRLTAEPGPRPFVGLDAVAVQIGAAPERAGLMTHHRAHDRALWAWLDGFLSEVSVVSFDEWMGGLPCAEDLEGASGTEGRGR